MLYIRTIASIFGLIVHDTVYIYINSNYIYELSVCTYTWELIMKTIMFYTEKI